MLPSWPLAPPGWSLFAWQPSWTKADGAGFGPSQTREGSLGEARLQFCSRLPEPRTNPGLLAGDRRRGDVEGSGTSSLWQFWRQPLHSSVTPGLPATPPPFFFPSYRQLA